MDLLNSSERPSSSWFVWSANLVCEMVTTQPLLQGKWGWREVVVFVGIGCTVANIVLVSLGTTYLVRFFSVVTLAVLIFSLDFVGRLQELARMRQLLDDFQGEIRKTHVILLGFEEHGRRTEALIARLEGHDQRSEVNYRLLGDRVAEVVRSALSLKQTVEQINQTKQNLENEVGHLRGEVGHLRAENQAFIAARDDFNSELGSKLRQLDEITNRQNAAAERFAALQIEIPLLERVRGRLDAEVSRLGAEVTRLGELLNTAASQNAQNRPPIYGFPRNHRQDDNWY